MIRLKGRRVALAAGVVAVLGLGVAALGHKDRLLSAWYRFRIRSPDRAASLDACRRSLALDPDAAIPLVLRKYLEELAERRARSKGTPTPHVGRFPLRLTGIETWVILKEAVGAAPDRCLPGLRKAVAGGGTEVMSPFNVPSHRSSRGSRRSAGRAGRR